SVSMEQLGRRFDAQQTQLGVLQSLLTDREVAANLIPSGMPVKDGYITSSFGERIDPFTGRRSFHPGLDIGAYRGEQVHAVASGVVTYAGIRDGYGKVVEIDHGDGYMTRYAHNSSLLARVGEHVHTGEVISDAGSTGRSTGPHVHFEVWHDGKLVNPSAYVRRYRRDHPALALVARAIIPQRRLAEVRYGWLGSWATGIRTPIRGLTVTTAAPWP